MTGFSENYSVIRRHIDNLIDKLPEIYGIILKEFDFYSVDGWEGLRQAPEEINLAGGVPVTVITFFGATGVGKSTIFRILTGLDVPAGDGRRPLTYRVFAAVPLIQGYEQIVRKSFPAFSCSECNEMSELTEKTDVIDEIYYGPYHLEAGSLYPIIVDVPDFNSTEEKNWVRAEKMMERAEVVIFVVTNQSYATEHSFNQLARVCKSAAHLIIIFNQTSSAESALEMWSDLKRKAENDWPAFREKRHDGKELYSFLEASHIYSLNRRSNLKKEYIIPVNSTSPKEFTSFINHENGIELLHKKLVCRIANGVEASEKILQDIELKYQEYIELVGDMRSALATKRAENILSYVPVGDFLETLLQFTSGKRVWWAKFLSAPSYVARKGFLIVKNMKERLSGGNSKIKERRSLEKRWLEKEIGDDFVRHYMKDKLGKISSQDENFSVRFERCRQRFLSMDIPEPGREWKSFVFEKLEVWAEENKWKSNVIPLFSDFLMTLAAVAIVADFMIDGGVILNGTLAAAGGAGAGVIKALESFTRYFGLEKVFDDVVAKWITLRREELSKHIEENFLDPAGLKDVKKIISGIENSPRESVHDSVQYLTTYIKQYGEKNEGDS